MQQVVFIFVFCVCFACHITISVGNSSDVRLESKIDTIKAQLDRSLFILEKDFKQQNVALRKTSQQSSWYANTRSWGNNQCCATDYANDGNPTTFSHTELENLPYWWVDLGHVYDIKRIEIKNRVNYGDRLRDLDITVGPTLKEMSLFAHYKGPGKDNELLVFRWNHQMSGRYVKVTMKGRGYLQLAEVKVFAPEIYE
ncbi:fucolectin-5-like [Mytilus californianus]|uniref:fucolectin-5-like n=1 Tax=Mytilus californianus TaxID=6549 RepID=UPI002246AD3C|nr:fucolectin-5-like [Mytilus californianus]